ncbi:hypothetical protein ES703_61957 [subsurface metagenome]
MVYTLFSQERTQVFRVFDRDRADQDWLSLFVAFGDFLHDCIPFFFSSSVYHIVVFVAEEGFVRRDFHHIQLIYGLKFSGFSDGCSCHPCQLVVHPEIILESDRCQGLIFFLYPHFFLGFQGLVQSVAVASSRHETAREFVHDDHFPFLDHVVHILFEQMMGLEGLIDMMDQIHVLQVIKIGNLEEFFRFGDALFGQGCGPGLLIHLVVFFIQAADKIIHLVVE